MAHTRTYPSLQRKRRPKRPEQLAWNMSKGAPCIKSKHHHCWMPSKKLEQLGALMQLRHVACKEVLHSLWSILTITRDHGLAVFILCVDLVKEFLGSVNHELLYKVFTKYGLLESLINVTKKMHSNCSVQISTGKEKVKDYEAGGQQQQHGTFPFPLPNASSIWNIQKHVQHEQTWFQATLSQMIYTTKEADSKAKKQMARNENARW